jgi:putative oxidoreductase
MNIALWILQALLAAFFLWHGTLYIAPPADMLEAVNSMITPGFRLFIGITEVLATIGLIFPSLTRIVPKLTVFAAAGLMIVTASACVFHLVRGEVGPAVFATLIFALVTVVAYGRWRVKPMAPRPARASALQSS